MFLNVNYLYFRLCLAFVKTSIYMNGLILLFCIYDCDFNVNTIRKVCGRL